VKKFGARTAAGAGINERADIGVAGRDDAGKRGINFLERLQVLQAFFVVLRGFLGCFCCGFFAGGIIGFLLGNGVDFLQAHITLGGDLRKVQISFRGGQIGACLLQLLVYSGGINFREQLSGLHVAADVHIPLL
jgi:hypothetical protein